MKSLLISALLAIVSSSAALASNLPVTSIAIYYNSACGYFQLNNTSTYYSVNTNTSTMGQNQWNQIVLAFNNYQLVGDLASAEIAVVSTYTDGTCGANTVNEMTAGTVH